MRLALVTLLLLAAPALADAPKVTIKDTYGFDYMRPRTSKCAKVAGALQKKLAKYTCAPPEKDVGTASGKPAVGTCKTAKEDSGYTLFAKLADCKEERETQLANGEG